VRALANLYAICRKYFPESHHIEMIDVLKDPIRAKHFLLLDQGSSDNK